MMSWLPMPSKEVSNFMWNCGKNPAKTTYCAGLKKNKMSLVAAGIRTLLYTLSGSVGYHLIIDPLCDERGNGEDYILHQTILSRAGKGPGNPTRAPAHHRPLSAWLMILTMISYSLHMISYWNMVWYCIWYQIWYHDQYFNALRHHPGQRRLQQMPHCVSS